MYTSGKKRTSFFGENKVQRKRWKPENRILKSGIQPLMESGIHGCGIRNPQAWNPESTAWNPESKTLLDYLTWGDICTSCQPFFLKSVKIQDEYKKAHAMFEKTQKSANPSILTADPVIEAKSKAGSITSTQASGEPEATFELLAHWIWRKIPEIAPSRKRPRLPLWVTIL